MSLLDLPWDDPAWRAQKDLRVARAMADFGAQHLQTISIMQTYDRGLRSVSRKHVTNCSGYWQSHDDRSRLSTIEDEWGI